MQNYCAGFLLPCKALKRSNAQCLASFNNEAGRQKDKQETANVIDLEYNMLSTASEPAFEELSAELADMRKRLGKPLTVAWR